jgi:FixJ family two-component response regulator
MTPEGVVYVVEDDASLRKAIAELVRSEGLAVETFPSAEAFLAFEPLDGPSCLVLDLQLPGPSGLELQAALGDAQRTMPIVFITGHGTVPASVRALQGGAVDFLEKPFEDEALLDGIRRALGQSRVARTETAARVMIERRLSALTRREREVLDLVVTGMMNKQIAVTLGAAEKTIKIHRGRVMRKMGAASVADLVRMMHTLGIDTSRS